MIVNDYEKMGSARAVAVRYGVSPQTVLNHVSRERSNRAQGLPCGSKPPRKRRRRGMDFYRDEVVAMVEQGHGKLCAKWAYRKLRCCPEFNLSLRTVQRAVAEAKKQYEQAHRRVFKPVVPIAGQIMQYDFGQGPVIEDGSRAVLFIAWMPWSRARFAMALADRKMASVQHALDAAFRFFGGVPEAVITDNEKTVSTGSLMDLPKMNPELVDFLAHYGAELYPCRPYEP